MEYVNSCLELTVKWKCVSFKTKDSLLMMYVWANVKHRTIEAIASSVGRASICRSTGRVSIVVGAATTPPPAFLVDRPRRKRRNDSRSVFLNDFRRDRVSPAPLRSMNNCKKKQKSV